MKNKYIIIGIVLIISLAVLVSFSGNKNYSIRDVKEANVVEQGENITILFLPDDTAIVINDRIGIGMIRQPKGISMSFTDKSLDATMRDGWITEDQNGKLTRLPGLQKNINIKREYYMDNAAIAGNGTAVFLPDNSAIYSHLEMNKTIIKLNSEIIIKKEDNSMNLSVILPDGMMVKLKNKSWTRVV